jgi:hypothetical protein
MAWDSYQLPITRPLDRLAARSTQRSSAERIVVATLADTQHTAVCRRSSAKPRTNGRFSPIASSAFRARRSVHYRTYDAYFWCRLNERSGPTGVIQGHPPRREHSASPVSRCSRSATRCVSAPQRGGRTSRSGARAQRCSPRADHHRRLPRCSRDRLRAPLPVVRAGYSSVN